MKQLTAAIVTYGPFNVIEVRDDRYRCDGTDYPFNVIGPASVDEYVPPAPSLPTPPKKVTRRQALSALRINNITAPMVEVAIMNLPLTQLQIDLALIDFRESFEFEYDWPLMAPMCAAMGLNRAELFILAGSL